MWSRILVEKLIHKYRQHEYLYNSSHPFYADRARRAASLQDICRSLNKINKNITVYELKKKIHTLRSQYLKELRDMGKSRQEGVTGVLEPKLWCYDKLDFLKYHCHTKYSTIDDVEMEDVIEEVEEAHNNTEITCIFEDGDTQHNHPNDGESSDEFEFTSIDKTWTKELVKVLIEQYRQQENLYNTNDPRHMHRKTRHQSFLEMCEAINKINEHITVPDIKKKIHTLRSQYIRQLHDIREGKHEESRGRLWCFDRLDFLRPHCTFKNQVEAVEEVEEDHTPCNISEIEVLNETLVDGNVKGFREHENLIETKISSNQKIWSKNLVELLIDEYRKHANLYNSRHPLYLKRTARMNSLLEICQAINEINDNFTMEDVKKKIHTLRSQFLKELREFLDSKQDDVANQIMKPKLWCFDKLKFLKDHCSLKRSTTLEFEDSNALDTDPEFEELRENVLHEYEIEEMSRVASETSEEIIEEYCASDDLEEFDAQKYILWTKDMVEYLINRYRQHENLYNTKNPYYMDRPKRFNSMLAICKELKRYNQNLTVDDVKKKIHTLRSQYVKELRDIYLSQRDVVEPKLWCFEQMEFLKPYCRMKRKFSNNTIEKAAKYSPLNSSESNAEAYSECETPYELDQSTANRMWNRHLVQLLISKYRRHEHLYNTNNPQYLDREARLKSLQDIAKSLQRINANITIYHIKKKIHTLRTQYLKELRELQENAVGKATAPKLWCYRQLAFLEPHCVIKNSTANSNEVEMELVSNDPIGADEAHDINTFYLDYEEINEEFDLHEDNTLDKQDVLWTREMLELLIQKYQQHENLYNKTHAHYNNATKNLKSFRDICKSTKKLNPDITEEDVKNEINNLKRQYVEDLKRLEGRRDLKPKLWCFEQFAFLRPYCDDQRKYNLDDLEMQETDGNENAAYIECEKPIKDGKEHQTSKEILRYLRCGEILIASSCDYKDPYILKCDHCGDVYSAVDSFLNHCIYHFQLGEKNEIGLKENSCREQKSGCNEVNGATNELYSVEIAVDKFENPEMDEEGQDDDEHVEESQFNDLEDFEPLEYDPYVTEEFSVDEECQAYEGEDPLDLYGEEIESQFDEEEDYTMFSEQLHSKDPAELSSYDDQEYLYDEHIENVQTQNYTPVFVLNFIKSEKNLLAFIKAYHKQPYLWRRHHTDQIQRRNSPIYLQKIATELREHHHLSLNVKEVTMLIRHVRGQYRILLNPRTMAGEYKAKSTKTLTTRCARALEFLQPFMEISSISRLNEKHSNLSSRQIVQLLRIYQQFPNLWNTNRIEYVCRNKRQESLVAMQRQIKLKMDWATTLSDLRRYLYGLHIQCSREKSCSGKICKYYEHMAFLVDHVAPFKCSLCKRKFKSPFVLKIHHNEHAGDLHLLPPLQCNICQKNFNDFKLYKLHAQRHMDDLQEECTVCGKRFGKPFELRKHQQTHTNETPFCCELCGVAYRHNSSLIAHMRKHRSELCYKCNRCSKRFQSNVQLHEHMKTHQRNTITYDCDMCEKSFKSKETLNAHRASHLRKNEKCTICGEFFGESSLRKHMQGHLENGEVDDNMEGEDFIITIDSEKIHGF